MGDRLPSSFDEGGRSTSGRLAAIGRAGAVGSLSARSAAGLGLVTAATAVAGGRTAAGLSGIEAAVLAEAAPGWGGNTAGPAGFRTGAAGEGWPEVAGEPGRAGRERPVTAAPALDPCIPADAL